MFFSSSFSLLSTVLTRSYYRAACVCMHSAWCIHSAIKLTYVVRAYIVHAIDVAQCVRNNVYEPYTLRLLCPLYAFEKPNASEQYNPNPNTIHSNSSDETHATPDCVSCMHLKRTTAATTVTTTPLSDCTILVGFIVCNQLKTNNEASKTCFWFVPVISKLKFYIQTSIDYKT